MNEPKPVLAAKSKADDEDHEHFNGGLITVCVRLLLGADTKTIAAKVVGKKGELCPKSRAAMFWASTQMHLKQIDAIDGVKSCTLSFLRW